MIDPKRTVLAAVLAACAFAASASAAPPAQVPPEVRAKAAPVFEALAKIEHQAESPMGTTGSPAPSRPGRGSRRLTFSEAEFNAYAACRLEHEPYVKSAVLKLLAGNKVEGRLGIDLGKPQASGLVPQKQDLLFAARFETKDGKIRIDLDTLYLGTQAIPPSFLDLVIGIVSGLEGVKATSLEDWYDLPPGVLGLETLPGQVVVIY
jgi:hypothetical protein